MNKKLKNISIDRYTWYNCTGNVEVTPLRYFFPRNRKDLAEIIRDAEEKQLRVRAVGSGHSFSEAAKGKDYLLNMKFLSGVTEFDQSVMKRKFKEKDLKLVNVEAGTIIQKLNQKLDKMGLALENMGAVDVQTISGAVMTGTHGTGIKKPALPDMIRALKMVGTGGNYYQIEPTDGITDPDQHDPVVSGELIQDDERFYSAILSFGGMGIVYEIVLEVVPLYWMREKRVLRPWSELKQEILAEDFLKTLEEKDFWGFRVNPYEVKGDHRCAVVEQKIDKVENQPRGLAALSKNLLYLIGSNLEYLIESSIARLKKRPHTAKQTIQFGLWVTQDLAFHAKSYKVLYQGSTATLRHGIDSEFAFDADPKKIVAVLDRIFELAAETAEESGLYQSSFLSVRFTPKSKAYLSSAYGRKTCYIDIPMLYGTTGDTEILERYQKVMIGLGGIPHWGKYNNQLYLRNDFIREQFSEVDKWIEVRNRMDPKGTFLNDFIIKMGLGELIESSSPTRSASTM